jgi:hypothetical protein
MGIPAFFGTPGEAAIRPSSHDTFPNVTDHPKTFR